MTRGSHEPWKFWSRRAVPGSSDEQVNGFRAIRAFRVEGCSLVFGALGPWRVHVGVRVEVFGIIWFKRIYWNVAQGWPKANSSLSRGFLNSPGKKA